MFKFNCSLGNHHFWRCMLEHTKHQVHKWKFLQHALSRYVYNRSFSADQGGCYPQRPNSIIALLFIQNISSFLKEFRHYSLCFQFRSSNITQPCLQVFSVNGSIICGGLHFWRHFDFIGSIILGTLRFWRHRFNMAKILSKFGEQQLIMVNYACGFHQSEMGNILNE